MSSREKLKGKTISVKDFADFLNAKKISAKCPACNQENTAISVDEDGNVAQLRQEFAQFTEDGAVEAQESSVALVALTTCKNCGFIRLFSSGALARWLSNRDIEQKKIDE